MKHLLTIAGSDSGGGAGVQADLKTFAAHKCYGASVINSVTAQNTLGVRAIHDIPSDVVAAQLDAVFEDIRIDGVKIGMLSNGEIAHVVYEKLLKYKPSVIVLDPVMVSTSGSKLMSDTAIDVIKNSLIPIATVVTPNIPEAEVLSGIKINSSIDMENAAKKIAKLGCKNVFLKGGHLKNSADDLLYKKPEDKCVWLKSKRINTKNTHGTGCSISSAICAMLSCGCDIDEAVDAAKKYVYLGIENAEEIGGGNSPIHHFYEMWKEV